MPAWSWLFPAGFLGVDLFFVLSGFLITTLLLERRDRETHPLSMFWLRRALRLVPALAALLVVNFLVAVVLSKHVHDAALGLLVGLTYTTNLAQTHGIATRELSHLWSLAIEGQFYLVWPLVVFAALAVGASRRHLLAIVMVGVGAVVAWRIVRWHEGEGWLRLYLSTDARVDSLLVGAALALLPYDRLLGDLSGRGRTALGTLALAALLAAAWELRPDSAVLYDGGLTVVALLCAVLVTAALRPSSALTIALSTPVALALGRLSYSLYLWHFPLFRVVGDATRSWPASLSVVVTWSAVFLVATASHYLVERPALRLSIGWDVVPRATPRALDLPPSRSSRVRDAVPRRRRQPEARLSDTLSGSRILEQINRWPAQQRPRVPGLSGREAWRHGERSQAVFDALPERHAGRLEEVARGDRELHHPRVARDDLRGRSPGRRRTRRRCAGTAPVRERELRRPGTRCGTPRSFAGMRGFPPR